MNTHHRTTFPLLARTTFLLLALAATAAAQPKPDFTGIWKLNLAESDYSAAAGVRDPTLQLPVPESLVRTVKQKGDRLEYRVERVLGGRKYEFDVEVDIGGAEFSSNPAGIVTVERKGSSLVVSYVYNPRRERTERTEVWTLSADGQKLVEDMTFKDAEGKETRVKRVFDKQ